MGQSHYKVFLADGSTVCIRKKVVTPSFEIGEENVVNDLKVMDKMDRPIILGVGVHSKYKELTNFDNEQNALKIGMRPRIMIYMD